MDATRYFLGVLLIIGLPPAVLFWLLIHPLAGWWRRMRPWVTYAVVGTASFAPAGALYRFRGGLMGADLGTNWALITPGLLLYALSAWLSIVTRRQLSFRVFVGLPEISADHSRGVLLQEGIYGVVRHPRYLSVIIGTAGFAMFVNFSGPYLMVLGSLLALLLVVILEERELSRRFGADYEGYRSRVPALIPRFPTRAGSAPDDS